jgi:hypothetical protein
MVPAAYAQLPDDATGLNPTLVRKRVPGDADLE